MVQLSRDVTVPTQSQVDPPSGAPSLRCFGVAGVPWLVDPLDRKRHVRKKLTLLPKSMYPLLRVLIVQYCAPPGPNVPAHPGKPSWWKCL